MSTMLPVLTAYEKEHLSERQPLPERYLALSEDEMDALAERTEAILAAGVLPEPGEHRPFPWPPV